MKVSADIVSIIQSAHIDGQHMKLAGQLSPDIYRKTAKVIEAAGGKWNRKLGLHVFESDAFSSLEPILLTGQIAAPADFGFFPTSVSLATELVDEAGVAPGMIALEPSAGSARIAHALAARGAKVICVELQQKLADRLSSEFPTHCCDFLAMPSNAIEPVDVVCMNPPFAKQDDIRHVMHACKFLKPGGTLAAIMSASVSFRSNGLAPGFREFVASQGGTITMNPEGAFLESGTAVRTVKVLIPSVYL